MSNQHTTSATNVSWLQVFFAVAACSWVPHWACHYYRLETGSSFVVGNCEITRADSLIFMVLYSVLIGLNLAAISLASARFWAALDFGPWAFSSRRVAHLSVVKAVSLRGVRVSVVESRVNSRSRCRSSVRYSLPLCRVLHSASTVLLELITSANPSTNAPPKNTRRLLNVNVWRHPKSERNRICRLLHPA